METPGWSRAAGSQTKSRCRLCRSHRHRKAWSREVRRPDGLACRNHRRQSRRRRDVAEGRCTGRCERRPRHDASDVGHRHRSSRFAHRQPAARASGRYGADSRPMERAHSTGRESSTTPRCSPISSCRLRPPLLLRCRRHPRDDRQRWKRLPAACRSSAPQARR